MSRSRQRVEILRQISGIRAISARLAEAKCVAANQEIVIAHDKHKKQQDHLQDAIGGWQGAISAAHFDPESLIFWGHAINQAVLNVELAGSDVNRCNANLKHAERHLAGMIANEGCAETLLAKARKKHFNDVENRHLAEQADQITRSEMRR